MKKIVLVFFGLMIATTVYAKDITVTLTQEQYDALTVLRETPEQWVQNAATNKANKMIERLVLKYSDKQPGKLNTAQKKEVINGIDLAEERRQRHGQ